MLKKHIAVLAGVVSISLLTSVASQAATSKGAPITRFDGIDEVVEACTNSTTFVTIPQMTRTFTLGGTSNDEVAVLFQGAFSLDESAGPFDTGFIRLLIDNNVQGPGNQVPVKNPEGGTSTHGFNWQSKTLTPGSHTVKVQWRTDLGATFCVDVRSLIILHR